MEDQEDSGKYNVEVFLFGVIHRGRPPFGDLLDFDF